MGGRSSFMGILAVGVAGFIGVAAIFQLNRGNLASVASSTTTSLGSDLFSTGL